MQYADVPWLIWGSFLTLTALHVYANIQAVRALTLTSLNPSRLQLLVDTFYHKVCLASIESSAQMLLRATGVKPSLAHILREH